MTDEIQEGSDTAGLITEHLDLWTSAITHKSTSGRGVNGKIELTGIKKLRELILELAVRGKLVEQDLDDESASVLLERVAEEKALLVKQGKIKKQKNLPEIAEEEIANELPPTWSWARLGEVTNYGITEKAEPNEVEETTWVLELEDIEKESSRLIRRVTYGTRPFKSSKNRFRPDDVLYGKLRPYLDKVLVADRPGVCTTEIIPVRGVSGIAASYLRLALKSPSFKAYANDSTHGMNLPRLGTDKARLALIPLPPFKEQHRIVEKVDELMTLCDRLEQQVGDQLEAHEVLVDTLLDALTRSTDAKELTKTWARVAEHFDTLFTTEASIDKLKQTILQLAVMGRLVEQDAGDEPAVALLQSIESNKAELIKSGVIKRNKPLPPVSQKEHPFKLPNGWGCHRLGELVSKLGSGSTPRGGQRAYVDDGVPFLRSQNIWNDGLRLEDIVYISEDTHARMGNTVVYPKDLLLNITGASLGRSTIFPDQIPEANVSQHVTIIRLIEPAMTPFVHLCIQSPLIQSLVWGRQVGMAIEGLSKKVLERFEMPIPPLEEQHRIVQMVDELMALCDQLKERLNQAGEIRCQLAETVVEQATNTEVSYA
jgi:type I restriction enzyme S subunit